MPSSIEDSNIMASEHQDAKPHQTEDHHKPAAWPPAPTSNFQPSVPPVPARPASWVSALLAALLGAGIGAILLPCLLFTAFFIMNDAGGPIFFVMAVFASIVLGALSGSIIGLAVWFIRRARKR